MSYPTSTDYVAAVQSSEALLKPELKRAIFDVHPLLQVPMPASGNSAVVFKVTVDHRLYAFRFFIRDDAASRERYRSLHTYVQKHHLTDAAATAEWVDDAILINRQRLPMVRMEWVEGRSLDAYVEHLVRTGDPAAIALLAAAWSDLVQHLQSEGFAHGDLQHGNVLVDTTGRLRLVDFDGSWVDGVQWTPPNETGHPSYQLRHRTWGRWMDTFPGLLVHMSLTALTHRPDLWRRYSGRENLLFTREDLVPPFRTDLWSDLAKIGDPAITRGIAQLQQACRSNSSPAVSLHDLLHDSRPVQMAAPTTSSIGMPALQRDRPWWEQVSQPIGAAPASPPVPPRAATGGPGAGRLPPPPTKGGTEVPEPSNFARPGGRPPLPPPAKTTSPPPSPGYTSGSPRAGTSSRPTSPGIPASAVPPPPSVPTPPTPRPPTPPPRRRTAVWVLTGSVLVVLLVIIVGILATGDPGSGSTSGGTSTLPPTSAPTTPRRSSPSPTDPTTSAADALRLHVPYAIRDSCIDVEPDSALGAVAAVECDSYTYELKIQYFQFETTTAMNDAFDESYSLSGENGCIDEQSGTNSWDHGSVSCYTNSDNDVMTWTNDPTDILAVAFADEMPYSKLVEASEPLSPTSE